MAEKVIGIIGGIGPEATLDLFKKILRNTPARMDQEHLRILIDCNPMIPDRVRAIFSKGEDPAPALIATAQNLERAGADILLLACNAAHYYLPTIVAGVSIPVLNMIEETADFCAERFSNVRTPGLLAQTSTIRLGLYDKAFERVNKKIIHPDSKGQEIVRRCIYEIKAGNLGREVKAQLLHVGKDLIASGAEVVIMGCTEIPLVLENGDLAVPLIDPTDLYAQSAVTQARGL